VLCNFSYICLCSPPILRLIKRYQTIVFESLANSACNPSDFLCICNELITLGVAASIATTCIPNEAAQYNAFQQTVCANGPFVPTTTIVVTPPPAPVNDSTSTPLPPASTPAPEPTPAPVPTPPASNGTAPGAGAGVGNGTTLVPAGMTHTPGVPGAGVTLPPQFTGGAGAVQIGGLAGLVGLIGFVFAEL
jgi:hypothetical protein